MSATMPGEPIRRVVLAYSGSLETSAAIPWLAEAHDAQVVTITLDIGQGFELTHLRERALVAGAVRAHVLDAREEFVRGYVLPALRAGAFSPGQAFPGTALSRALIARRLVDIARMEGAGIVAHGCSCDDEDRALIEGAVRTLNPELTIVAPVCEWGMSASEVEEFARARHIPVAPAGAHRAVDANIWGRLICGPPTPRDYTLTRAVGETPEEAAFVEVEFEDGVPVRTNGVEMPIIEMIESIETIAGTHGVGRIAGPNGAFAESPAAVVLHAAHAELSRILKNGGSEAAGSVRIRLFKGACDVVQSRPSLSPRGRRGKPEAVA